MMIFGIGTDLSLAAYLGLAWIQRVRPADPKHHLQVHGPAQAAQVAQADLHHFFMQIPTITTAWPCSSSCRSPSPLQHDPAQVAYVDPHHHFSCLITLLNAHMLAPTTTAGRSRHPTACPCLPMMVANIPGNFYGKPGLRCNLPAYHS